MGLVYGLEMNPMFGATMWLAVPWRVITYDLRRLRAHGFIERIPKTRRYQLTDIGLQEALLF